MIFTHLGRIVALIALVGGILHVVIGVFIATEILEPYQAVLGQYYPPARSSSVIIDRGLYVVLFSIALGVMTEISYALRAQAAPPSRLGQTQ
jgi:hypothetical protein